MNSPFHTKYRPQQFKNVVGHDHVIEALYTAFEKDTIPTAILFTGITGIGKTTLARLIAKRLNCTEAKDIAQDENSNDVEVDTFEPCNKCENCLALEKGNHNDVQEINAANNNGVDYMRELLRSLAYGPSIGKYRIIILDEVHRFTPESFELMLKPLEEPRKYVKFILCTTLPTKIPKTIKSRCRHYKLWNADEKTITTVLKDIIFQEKYQIGNETLKQIIKYARGSIRDAIQILSQLLSTGEITPQNVTKIVGIVQISSVKTYIDAIKEIHTEHLGMKSKEFDKAKTKCLRIAKNLSEAGNVQTTLEVIITYLIGSDLALETKARYLEDIGKVILMLPLMENKRLTMGYLTTQLMRSATKP